MTANPFEVVGVVTGVLAVWLTTRQKIWCWPVGIVSVASFIVVFFHAKLYAAMGLQVRVRRAASTAGTRGCTEARTTAG